MVEKGYFWYYFPVGIVKSFLESRTGVLLGFFSQRTTVKLVRHLLVSSIELVISVRQFG